MKVSLTDIEVGRGTFSLQGTGTFCEGLHLVWGPTGCGKTTLALLLAGLLLPCRGEILREGVEQVRFLMQFPEYQLTSRTVQEEVESWGVDAQEILSQTGLAEQKMADPFSLSRGELKRLLLATLLGSGADMILLDEPFGGMDCRERQRFFTKLHGRMGKITVLFTHDHGIFPRIDHLWEIQNGELLYRGRMPEALPRWSCPPPYLLPYLAQGVLPANISPDDLWGGP
jgi:energy-coupling factor transport system ATP-binding protein